PGNFVVAVPQSAQRLERVLAVVRRTMVNASRRGAEADRRARYDRWPAGARVLDFGQHAARLDVRVCEDVRDGLYRTERNASTKQRGELALGPCSRPLRHEVVDERAVLRARDLELGAIVLDEIVPIHDPCELRPEGVIRAGDRHPPILRLVQPEWAEEWMGIALRLGDHTGE